MPFPAAARTMLQAVEDQFRNVQQMYRRRKRTQPTCLDDAEPDHEMQESECSRSRRRSSFYHFIALQLRDLTGNDLLLLNRRLTLESEARVLTENSTVEETYPVTDITTHCVTHLSNAELAMVEQAITEEFKRRGKLAHEKASDEEEDFEASLIPADEALESMGHVNLAEIDKAGSSSCVRLDRGGHQKKPGG